MLEQVFVSDSLEGAYRVYLARRSANMSSRLHMFLAIGYLLSLYRIVLLPLTPRRGGIMLIQLFMALLHTWTAWYLTLRTHYTLTHHTQVKSKVVLVSLVAILLTSSLLHDDEITFRSVVTTGIVRASIITFQQFPLDVTFHMHIVSWIAGLFIALHRFIEVGLAKPYTLHEMARDLTLCMLLCGAIPAWLTMTLEASDRKRFLLSWRAINGERRNGQIDVAPFWSNLLAID